MGQEAAATPMQKWCLGHLKAPGSRGTEPQHSAPKGPPPALASAPAEPSYISCLRCTGRTQPCSDSSCPRPCLEPGSTPRAWAWCPGGARDWHRPYLLRAAAPGLPGPWRVPRTVPGCPWLCHVLADGAMGAVLPGSCFSKHRQALQESSVARPGAPASPGPAPLPFACASNALSGNGSRALDDAGHPWALLAPQGRAMATVGWCPVSHRSVPPPATLSIPKAPAREIL